MIISADGQFCVVFAERLIRILVAHHRFLRQDARVVLTVVPRAEYHWGAFRYSTATDAIAAAERSAR